MVHDPAIHTMDDFLVRFRATHNFAWTKINHGFWEALGSVEARLGWPVAPSDHREADRIAGRPHFFEGGFVDELITLIESGPHSGLQVAFELSAWPGDGRIIGTPYRPDLSRPVMDRYAVHAQPGSDGLLMKRAISDGSMHDLFDELATHHLVVVGPAHLESLASFIGSTSSEHVVIHPTRAREVRREIERQIEAAIQRGGDGTVVLLQAGTLAPYWIMRLRPRHPGVRWIDGGLAFSISVPETDILHRPWGKAHRKSIVAFYNARRPDHALPENELSPIVEAALSEQVEPEVGGAVAFVANEPPSLSRIGSLLTTSERYNQWANGGPLVRALERAYEQYLRPPSGTTVVAVANGGMALEALARVHDARAPDVHTWAVSAFTFKNQARGYFSNAEVLDCDDRGMLDVDALQRALERGSVDAFVVTNIFGLWVGFEQYTEMARRFGAAMLIDNAAGIGPEIPDWPFQAFSLHHTKPFGFGEGGLAVVPSDWRKEFESLLTYDDLTLDPAHWLNNGKLSDGAAAYHLDRLERSPEWVPLYEMQGKRIKHLAVRSGLSPLFDWGKHRVATSMPYLSPAPTTPERLSNPFLVLGKYYKPLADRSRAEAIYRHIVNIPTHPDVAQVDTDDLLNVFGALAT